MKMIQKKLRITGLLICLFFLLTACGQKGDLYLPGKKQASNPFDMPFLIS